MTHVGIALGCVCLIDVIVLIHQEKLPGSWEASNILSLLLTIIDHYH